MNVRSPMTGAPAVGTERRTAPDSPATSPAGSAVSVLGPLERLSSRAALLLVTALGAVLRLLWFGRYRLEGTDCDGAGYMDVARHIVAGAGFSTNIYKYLYLPPERLPQPDAHWNPLYPYLTAGAFSLFGESLFAAKLVPLLLGLAVPALVYLLARALTGDRRVALVAGLIAAVHPVLVTWSLRIETEIGTILLVTAAFVLMARRGTAAAVALGVVTGLAWWMKYQSGLVWVAILTQALVMRAPRRSLRQLAIVAAAFAVTIAPWLIRNALVFGDPFYTDLRTDTISAYPSLGSVDRVWASLTPPPPPIPFLLSHVGEVLRHIKVNLVAYARMLPPEFAGSLLFLPFILAGAIAQRRRWREWLPPLVYMAAILALFTFSTGQVRYHYSDIPFFIVLAAAGVVALAGAFASPEPRRSGLVPAAVAIVFVIALADSVRIGAATATDRRAVWTPGANCCALEHLSAADYLRSHAGPRDGVMAAEPYHAGYLFRRPTVNLPFDERAIQPLAAKYGIRYLVVSDRERAPRLPAWSQGPPAWAHVVARITPEQIASRFGAADYPHLSPVTVYELDLPRTAGVADVR